MAKLASVLSSHTIIGLDTNPFIYPFEHHPHYFPLVEELFLYLKSPGTAGITSIITLIETCVQPQRDGRTDLIQIYEKTLLNSQQVQMYDIDPILAKRAIQCECNMVFECPMPCN